MVRRTSYWLWVIFSSHRRIVYISFEIYFQCLIYFEILRYVYAPLHCSRGELIWGLYIHGHCRVKFDFILITFLGILLRLYLLFCNYDLDTTQQCLNLFKHINICFHQLFKKVDRMGPSYYTDRLNKYLDQIIWIMKSFVVLSIGVWES